MTSRRQMLKEVSRRLEGRELVWAGLRGDDIEPLADLPNLAGAFSIFAAYEARSTVAALAYEDITGLRVDPELWDIDEHLREDATVQFRRAMLRALSGPSALLPYRPSQFLSAISFARRDRCTHLGLFGAHQSAFEHKPWVESAIAELGLPHVPWTYVADEEQLQARQLARFGPVVLRRSRTSGGEGISRVEAASDISYRWPSVDEAFVSVAPYIDGAMPINVGATVWRDGVTVHHPSVQLIGLSACVTREFGYCGNDFGATREMSVRTIDQLEASTTTIGNWLRSYGYLGTFGVDYLIHDGIPLFTEINPRFQGSTHTSCRIAIDADEPCLMLEHLAAWLGIDRPDMHPLRARVKAIPDITNLVVHWTGAGAGCVDALSLVRSIRTKVRDVRGDVLARPGTTVAPGAAVARLQIGARITQTGYEIDDSINDTIRRWNTLQQGVIEGQPAAIDNQYVLEGD